MFQPVDIKTDYRQSSTWYYCSCHNTLRGKRFCIVHRGDLASSFGHLRYFCSKNSYDKNILLPISSSFTSWGGVWSMMVNLYSTVRNTTHFNNLPRLRNSELCQCSLLKPFEMTFTPVRGSWRDAILVFKFRSTSKLYSVCHQTSQKLY